MQALQNITQTYDNNGNLTNDGTWTHTWNYKNQITQSTKANATTTYSYDHTGARMKTVEAGVTTITPNSLYSITGATSTKHIFANGNLVATIEKTGTSTPTVRYIATDHLGGTSAVTNQSGALVESTDYNPYGTIRVDTKVGNYSEKRKYAGTEFDASTGLNYMQARYQNGAQGRFISQDPVFWEKQNLKDPQSLNSYSYANNNPIVNKDPSGRCVEDLCIGETLFAIGFVSNLAFQYSGDVIQNRQNGASNPYKPTSSVADYTLGGLSSGASTAFLGEAKIANAGLSGVTSLGQDFFSNRPFDLQKASLSAGTTYITGSLFGLTAGKSPLTNALKKAEQGVTSSGINSGIKYETTGAVFSSSVSTLVENQYSKTGNAVTTPTTIQKSPVITNTKKK